MYENLNLLANLIDNDAEACAELKACKSKEAVLEVLSRYNISMTAEEFDKLIAQYEVDELTEDMLMDVAGGGIGKALKKVAGFFKDVVHGFLDAM